MEIKVEGNTKKYFDVESIIDTPSGRYKVLDQNSDDTLLAAVNNNDEVIDRFIIAWGMQTDGTWNQGHYFTNEKEARREFDERFDDRSRW